MATEVNVVNSGGVQTAPGATGMNTQVPGQPTTVSGVAEATGGVGAGNFVEVDIDQDLLQFEKDETPLMNLMLNAKVVNVDSPEVDHYMIDSERESVTTSAALGSVSTTATAILPLSAEEQNIPRAYDTLSLLGPKSYAPDGRTETPGKPLQLMVVGHDDASGNPIVRAVNGPKTNPSDEYCKVPAIPAGTSCKLLANALYETQKEVDPNVIVPVPTRLYLQKRGMNSVVSDYFDSQKKRIPFAQALIAEAQIRNFKVRGNRTLWNGIGGKFRVNVPKLGMQYIYFGTGVRWQFKRELQHTGKWTYEEFIALMKMYYTGEDVPKSALGLAGKNFLENIQCIDFSDHPEVKIDVTTSNLGWEVTRIHTVFGDVMFKREPTLDSLGYSNSCAIIAEDRLVHYKRTIEHSFSDRIEGEEATRTGELVWDTLGLKGVCHIWIDGEGEGVSAGATGFSMWSKATAPTGADLITDMVYYLLVDCPGINSKALAGKMWQYKGAEKGWIEYKGTVLAAED